MSTTVFTGWRMITPGKCSVCGSDDDWVCDGRGNVLCGCQACPDCYELSAYGFHKSGCPALEPDEDAATRSGEAFEPFEPCYEGEES